MARFPITLLGFPPVLPFRDSYSFWLVRAALLRGLGLIYAAAFLIWVRQGRALVGQHGILPAARYLENVGNLFQSRGAAFWKLPSLFWLSSSDACLQACA